MNDKTTKAHEKKPMKVTILREDEIRTCVVMNEEAIDAVALGFTRLVEGKVSLPPTHPHFRHNIVDFVRSQLIAPDLIEAEV